MTRSIQRPWVVGRRGGMWIAILVVGGLALLALGLGPSTLVPSEAGLRVAGRFFSAALSPALDYQGNVPASAPPFLLRLAGSLLRTLAFAAAAMSLAIPVGALLGFLASDSWWSAGTSRWARPVQVVVRIWIALLRSVHEFLWAVVLLAAMGLSTTAGVVAISIPFAGTLAKVFSEMLDEAPRSSAHALRTVGAGPVLVFLFGQLPRALPDMAAYAFYRFECAVRSSAVLGFFGYPTLGYHLVLSFDSLYFREVWTYLYALAGLVVLFEAWSGRLRRSYVA